MEKTLSSEKMYRALIEKNSSFEGIFIACVKTTGIFCLPTCSAKKPHPQNVEFVPTTRDALRKSYRPCKVCRPMNSLEKPPPWLKILFDEIEKKQKWRFKDQELRDRGIDPGQVRRWFQKNHHITFQTYLRARRFGRAMGYITAEGKVINSAFQHNCDSHNNFNTTFKNLTGKNPAPIKGNNVIKTYQIMTPLGPMLAASVLEGLCLLEFTDRRMLERELIDLQRKIKAPIINSPSNLIMVLKKQLQEYFSKRRKKFDLPLYTPGSDFQKNVWQELQSIPYGKTRSYQKQAQIIKRPQAHRAVARAHGENKLAILIPCHRVLGGEGDLGGYGGGLDRKRYLLDLESSSL